MAPYTSDQVEQAKQIRRGIEIATSNEGFGWREGYRNTMAVDLACALWILGYKDYESQSDWVEAELSLDTYDFNDCVDRLYVISGYLPKWDGCTNGVFDKMLDPDEWISWSDNTE